MCGIAGILAPGKRLDPLWIRDMTEALKHRGPDDEGYLAYNRDSGKSVSLIGAESQIDGPRLESHAGPSDVFLGHRRLSIIDLSPNGHQPFGNESRTAWLVFNGEIYNYLSLREELKSLGYPFRTETDTEVVLAAYEKWGEACLERFDGMWSLAVLDTRRRVLFAARDRFGIKPFYYYHGDGLFAFASEIKSLLKVPPIRHEVRSEAVFDFLVFGWVEHETESLVRGISELQPSQALRLDLADGSLKTWKYYSLRFNPAREEFDPKRAEACVADIRTLLFDAVRTHLQSDVPVGSCLSGGLDSSTIVCVINQILEREHPRQVGERQKVFTVGYGPGHGEDESRWAQVVVDKTRTAWHRIVPDPERIGEELEKIVYCQDVPFGSSSGVIPQHFLMKSVREAGVKVLLDGQGGDELFAGYRGYYLASILDHLRGGRLPGAARELRQLGNSSVNVGFLLSTFLKRVLPKVTPSALLGGVLRRSRPEIKYLRPGFLSKHKDRLRSYQEHGLPGLNEDLAETMTGHEFKYLLRYEDRNSMAYSIEARTPFADHLPLIEFLFQIPGSYKIHDGWSKYLLRQATRDILPEAIRWRKDKQGFPAPGNYWLGYLRPVLNSRLSGPGSEYWDDKALARDSEAMIGTPASPEANLFLWRALVLATWLKAFDIA